MSSAYLEVKITGGLCYSTPEDLTVAETLYDVRSRHHFGEQMVAVERIYVAGGGDMSGVSLAAYAGWMSLMKAIQDWIPIWSSAVTAVRAPLFD